MGYDIMLWKARKRTTLSPAAVYLCFCEGTPCEDQVARFPRPRIARALHRAFGEELPFELDICDDYLHVTLPSGDAGASLLAVLEQLARSEALTLYDPQADPPTDADECAAALAAPVSAEPGAEEYLQQAAAGDVAAMSNLGTCYFRGEGVEKDLTRAVSWYRRSAELGFLPALLNLADCYRKGEGVPKDTREAIRLYETALEKDPCVSAFALGEIYSESDGVEHSIDRAEQYFKMARANLHPEAYLALKRIGRTPSD